MTDENKFDFTGLKTYPPSGCRVTYAGTDYFQLTRETAARNMTFIVFKEAGEFRLHARNPALGPINRELCNESNFVMRADNIATILRALGYAKARVKDIERQQIIPLTR